MTDPWNWTKDDLEKLIGQAESIRMDFKQSLLFTQPRERIADNLTQEVSAFANTEGGVIVIGIAEKRVGKSRISSQIDNGVDIADWSGERIEQILAL